MLYVNLLFYNMQTHAIVSLRLSSCEHALLHHPISDQDPHNSCLLCYGQPTPPRAPTSTLPTHLRSANAPSSAPTSTLPTHLLILYTHLAAQPESIAISRYRSTHRNEQLCSSSRTLTLLSLSKSTRASRCNSKASKTSVLIADDLCTRCLPCVHSIGASIRTC